MSQFLVPRRQDRVPLDEKHRRFADRPTAQSARHFQGATTSVTSSWLFRSEGDGSRPSPRSPRRPRPTVARSPCHRAAYSPGPYQPSVSSPLAPAPAQASPSSTSRLSYRTRTSDPIEPSALSCRVTCVKQQSRSVPTACARRRHDLSRQQTARRLEAQVAIGADSTAVRCAGLLLAMSNHTWVGTTSINLAFPAERESARTSNALPHRTTSATRRRRVSKTALGQAKQRTGTPRERSSRACICTAASSLSRLWRSSKLRRLLVSPKTISAEAADTQFRNAGRSGCLAAARSPRGIVPSVSAAEVRKHFSFDESWAGAASAPSDRGYRIRATRPAVPALTVLGCADPWTTGACCDRGRVGVVVAAGYE